MRTSNIGSTSAISAAAEPVPFSGRRSAAPHHSIRYGTLFLTSLHRAVARSALSISPINLDVDVAGRPVRARFASRMARPGRCRSNR